MKYSLRALKRLPVHGKMKKWQVPNSIPAIPDVFILEASDYHEFRDHVDFFKGFGIRYHYTELTEAQTEALDLSIYSAVFKRHGSQ